MAISWSFPRSADCHRKAVDSRTYLANMKKMVYEKLRESGPAIYGHCNLDKDLVSSAKDRKLNYSTPLESFFYSARYRMSPVCSSCFNS
jgi:sec-independent protein translocase protein TatC